MSVDLRWLVVAFRTRYGGIYEGARWAAMLVNDEIPGEALGDDVTAQEWWTSPAADLVGRGASADEAVADLARRDHMAADTLGVGL